MSEIILCNQHLSLGHLKSNCGIEGDLVHGLTCHKPETLQAFTPYLLGKEKNSQQQQIINQLSLKPTATELTNLSLSFGGDNTLAIAEITKQLNDFNISLMGATTSVHGERIGGFAKAVKEYQDALMTYRSALSNPANRRSARDNVIRAFKKLQMRFRFELNAINTTIKTRRGTPLSSSNRAINIARSSRNIANLKVSTQRQASNLSRRAQQTKYLGNGLAFIDLSSRIGNIHNSYKAGSNWERELFIESFSFATSAGAGILAAKAGAAALGFLAVATPVGWVGLIIGGLAVATGGAVATTVVNNIFKANSGKIYDSIMKGINYEFAY
jgi:hypothetical protein